MVGPIGTVLSRQLKKCFLRTQQVWPDGSWFRLFTQKAVHACQAEAPLGGMASLLPLRLAQAGEGQKKYLPSHCEIIISLANNCTKHDSLTFSI
jgi:hypothetical protein